MNAYKERTIDGVELLGLEQVLPIVPEHVVVCFIEPRYRCQLWPGHIGEWVEVKAVNTQIDHVQDESHQSGPDRPDEQVARYIQSHVVVEK